MGDSRETHRTGAFVVGYPIKHSRSPLIHRHWLAHHGLAGFYEQVAVAPQDFPRFIEALRTRGSAYRGGNVTLPHKELAFQLADRPDALASELGAANTLWIDEGLVHATNTDGYGFVANLDQQHPGWDRAETAVVLGAGGASRAVIQAIRDRGIATIHLLNRTESKAWDLATRFGARVHAHRFDALNEVIGGAALVVNTTSLGLQGEAFPAIAWDRLAPQALVTDIVYVPLRTPFLQAAADAGLATADGLGMLLHQAVPGFERWFGLRPAVTAPLRAQIVADLEAVG